MMCKILILLLLFLFCVPNINADFIFPNVQLEALKSGGFRAFIPDVPEVRLFAFHGNVNKKIDLLRLGSVDRETETPVNGYWVLSFPNKLKVGDRVNYWAFVNTVNNHLGYRIANQSWKVTELLDGYSVLGIECHKASTVINRGTTTCLHAVIIEDQFNGPGVNTSTWTVKHLIPTYSSADFEFNTYENNEQTRFFKNGVLYLKPIAKTDDEVRGTLNFTTGCTSNKNSKCYYEHKSSFLLPPVRSAKITSQTSFRYGKIEVKAKLPSGDWIFPIIQLEPKSDDDENAAKVWIAYSRGNNHLFRANLDGIDVRGPERDDIGSRILFAGPVLHPTEPGRSKELVSERSNTNPYNADFHLYTLNWTPGRMSFFIDSRMIGSVDLRKHFADPSLGIGEKWVTPEAPFDKEYVISLGVGVGGINDFPDGYSSGDSPKPWINDDRNFVKNFFDAKDTWSKTWNGDDVALQVDYVKVTAV